MLLLGRGFVDPTGLSAQVERSERKSESNKGGKVRYTRQKKTTETMDTMDTSLSGGRLLDQGLYGCVFTPALACKKGTEQTVGDEAGAERMLSKLLPLGDAEQEFQIAKRVARIPFYRQYFVVSDTLCEPAAVQPTEKEFSQCRMREKAEEENLRLLRMRYAGKALHLVSLNLKTFDVRAFGVHLIAAGALMNLFGVVHRDLHQGNVLVDTYHVPRIIDFNLSISVRASTKVTVSDLSHTYDVSITQEPPDSTLVNAIAHGKNPMTVIQEICFTKPVMHKVTTMLGISKRDMYQSLVTFYKKSKSMRSGDMERWFSLYYRVIDSWAIGVMLVELIAKLSLWPAMGFKIQRVLEEWKPMLRRMCAVNPLERIDCVQALQQVDPGHIVIRRYGAKWLDIVGKV